MAKRARLLGTVAVICLTIGGVALASNMTFKFVPTLTDDPDVYRISLPLVNNYTDLASIFNDIDVSPGCFARSVTTFNICDPGSSGDKKSCTWNGPYSCNTPLEPGEGISVSVSGPGCTWIIVGAHNPIFKFNLSNTDPCAYEVSVPYHTTAMTLAELCAEIPNCASVTSFFPDQSSCSWVGPLSCNKPLNVGVAVRVSVTASSSWTPSHY